MTTNLVKQDEFDIGIDLSDMMMLVMMIVMVQLMASVSALSAQVSSL